MMYRDTDGYCLYQMAPKFPNCVVVNTTTK